MTSPRWEYMQTNTLWPKMAGEVAKMDEEWHALEIGRNGWELVTVVRTPSGTLTAFFKRLVEEVAEVDKFVEATNTLITLDREPRKRKGGRQ